MILSVGSASAALSAPPPGFSWLLVSSEEYTDSDFFAQDLNLSQNLAPAAPPAGGLISGSLSVTTFDPIAEELALEAAFPPQDFGIDVTSSSYVVSLNGSVAATIANFDTTLPFHTYTGTVALDSWQISNDGSAGPGSSALVNLAPGVVVPMTTLGPFKDVGGAATAFLNLSDVGAAPFDGSSMTFDLSGAVRLDLSSDGPFAPFQVASANAQATGNATLVTRYDVYTLVPEPGAVALSVLGAMLLLRRRRD